MKKFTALAALSCLIAVPAVAQDATNSITTETHSQYKPDANGGYEVNHTNTTSDSAGTTFTQNSKKVNVNEFGDQSTTVAKTKSSVDANGNTSTSTVKTHNAAPADSTVTVTHNSSTSDTAE
jgi:hypothetical protein